MNEPANHLRRARLPCWRRGGRRAGVKRLLLVFVAAVYAVAAAAAGEFKLPVPFVILDNSKGDFCKPTVEKVRSLVAESAAVREWLRQGVYTEKRLVLEIVADDSRSVSVPVAMVWKLVGIGGESRIVGEKSLTFGSGLIATRVNADDLMSATRDVVHRLVDSK